MNNLKIDLGAIAHNLRVIKEFLPCRVKIMGIVKSDAYGHGLVQVAKLLSKEGIDFLGVAYPFEAYELIRNGIKKTIVVLCGFQGREEAEIIVAHNIVPVIWERNMAELLNNEAKKAGKKLNVLLKVDTGMGRLGILYKKVGSFIREISSLNMLNVKGLLSHLSSADRINDSFTDMQIERFKMAINMCRNMGINLSMNSIANSAGMINYRESLFDIVRPGIMLYGAYPSAEFVGQLGLKQAMQFTGKIIQIKKLPFNTPVSYGRTYYTKAEEKIAIVSAGYGNGIPRAISNKGYVIIKDKRAPIVGQICMDLMACNITHIEDAKVGDDVIFLGYSKREKISPDDMAGWAETISYEIVCNIGKINNKREYCYETESRNAS